MADEYAYPLGPIERVLVAILAPLVAYVTKLLNMTCRVVGVEGEDMDRCVTEEHGGRASYCTWHQRVFYLSHYFGKIGATIMISRSREGEWGAHIARYLGFKNVRGSSRKKGKDKGAKRPCFS